MQVSLEYLYHFRCDRCDKWWSRADIEPQINEITFCPYCGHHNLVEGIQTFRNAALGDRVVVQVSDQIVNQNPINSDQIPEKISPEIPEQISERISVQISGKSCLERKPDH